jgi:hypothetical protein
MIPILFLLFTLSAAFDLNFSRDATWEEPDRWTMDESRKQLLNLLSRIEPQDDLDNAIKTMFKMAIVPCTISHRHLITVGSSIMKTAIEFPEEYHYTPVNTENLVNRPWYGQLLFYARSTSTRLPYAFAVVHLLDITASSRELIDALTQTFSKTDFLFDSVGDLRFGTVKNRK